MYKLIWRIRKGIDRLFYDERRAGFTRFLFTIFLTGSVILLGYALFENVDTSVIEESWAMRYPNSLIQWVIVRMVRGYYFFIFGLRHAIIPVSVFLGVLFASAFYVQDVYELPNFRLALRYMVASFLGIDYPYLVIEDGKKRLKKGQVNLIDTIGGPGYVNIRSGNVVLFESLRSPSSVRANALHFISRFETIKEIVSLDDQHGFIEKMNVRTKDGIQLVVRDIHYRYRLRTGRRFGDYEKRDAIDPYPFSVQAVKAMAYNRSVRSSGLSDWHAMVKLAMDSAVKDYVKSHNFDYLTAPNYEDDNPRAEIAEKMMSKAMRTRLRNVGAELLWFDVGHFGVAETMQAAVEEQRVDTWSARWDGDAMIIRAYGEARRMAYQEMGRAEGQAEMLLSIIQAFDEVGYEPGEGSEEQRLKNLRGIVWTRVAQVLDAIAEEENKKQPDKRLPPESPGG